MSSGRKEALLPKGVFITGTDTGVGKTVVSALILRALRERGIRAGAMKPIETGCGKANSESRIQDLKMETGGLIPADGIALREAAGMDDPLDLVAPVRFERPLAPMTAARLEKRPVDIKKIMNACNRLSEKYDLLVVEGAGGLLAPIKNSNKSSVTSNSKDSNELQVTSNELKTNDKDLSPSSDPLLVTRHSSLVTGRVAHHASRYFMSDLVRELGLPVIVVARPSLGTINHTLLTIEHALREEIEVLGIVINYALPPEGGLAEKTNPEVLRELSPVPLIGIVPYMKGASQKHNERKISSAARNIANHILKCVLPEMQGWES